MNRVDRLFAILLEFQQRRRLRAQDLAEKFEISKRTAYRDVTALSEMGVPIISLPGEGYELMEGFYLPPLVFTPDEAAALFLGAELLRSQASGRLIGAAEQALSKLRAALPKPSRQQAEQLSDIIRFHVLAEQFDLDEPRLLRLQQALVNQQLVEIVYHSFGRDEVTRRYIEPRQLVYADGVWYLNAYCRLRQDLREFRLDRIDQLWLLEERFEPRSLADAAYLRQVTVRIKFAPQVIRWVQERQHYGFAGHELTTADGYQVWRYELNDVLEMKGWIQSWGAQAEVLEPAELRAELRAEASRLVDLLSDERGQPGH